MIVPNADGPPSAGIDRVLVAAPFRRDAALLQEMLGKYGISAIGCADPADLARELSIDGAPLVMTQEALTRGMLDVLAGHLAAQSNWSELPLVLLLDADHQTSSVLAGLRARLPTSKLMVLQRPVRTLELVTTVQTAMSARRRQLQLRDHIIWQEELQHELNHRVKNAMANVLAIYHMTMRQSRSLDDFSAAFEGRLSALSRVHAALVVSGEPRALHEIADLVLAPYRSASAKRIRISGPAINVTPQIAVTLALSLHELATNAAKYGALSGPQGTLSLRWAVERGEEGAVVQLRWLEAGGPPVEAPSRRGYGTSFMRSAIKGMGGAIDFQFRAEGLSCVISIPAQMFASPAILDAAPAPKALAAAPEAQPRRRRSGASGDK
jgi:two-component sensor histidine kinase